jgi:putative ABC transport system permease protein
MPQGFSFPAHVEMWIPVGLLSDQEIWKVRDAHELLGVVARLKAGVTIEQARADMKNITAALEKEYPDTNQGRGATVIPLLEKYVRDIRRTLYVLLSAVGFVLLIACANVASLMLARAAAREKEMALRTALGASAGDVLRLVVWQGMKIVAAGVGLGLAGAFALTRLMKALLFEVSATDPITFISIGLLLAGAALLACFIPARRATKVDPMTAMRCE